MPARFRGIGRLGIAGRRQGEDVAAVGQDLHVVAVGIDHGFDGEDHPFPQHDAFAGTAVMQDGRLLPIIAASKSLHEEIQGIDDLIAMMLKVRHRLLQHRNRYGRQKLGCQDNVPPTDRQERVQSIGRLWRILWRQQRNYHTSLKIIKNSSLYIKQEPWSVRVSVNIKTGI